MEMGPGQAGPQAPMQEPQSADKQVQGDPEALAQQIMQGLSQLQQMVPAEIFQGFLKQLSTGGQEPEPGPVGPVPQEAGAAGIPR